METAIATHEVTKRFGDVVAVDRLSLRVGRGEIYGFLGLNGAGKTTTIRLLLGMIRPSAGNVEVFGKRVHAGLRDLWAGVGHLVETASAYPELTVRENLEVSRRLHRVRDPGAVERVIELLALTPYAERRAGRLSLGNAQRLGLAKALLHEPELLLLDEPANGLDPAGVVEVRELLRELARERGVTVFMSSHILSEVARLATRIGIIHEGRLLEEVYAEELEKHVRKRLLVGARNVEAAREALAGAGFASSEGEDGILTLDDPAAVERPEDIATLLVGAGAPPTLLRVYQEDLEAYFLRRVGMAGARQHE